MASPRIERRIDDVLLAVATFAGFTYVRRRVRRMFGRLAVGVGVGAGAGAVVAVGIALAWRRSRTAPPASD